MCLAICAMTAMAPIAAAATRSPRTPGHSLNIIDSTIKFEQVTDHGFVIHVSVNPAGASSTVYAAVKGNGERVRTRKVGIGSGSAPVPVTLHVSGLLPHANYRVTIWAYNVAVGENTPDFGVRTR
jgi:hypothetical protein